MSDSNITKQALADSLKALMLVRPFKKISVGDIAERCGLTRQAFYYHFKDKYDLMNWIYYTETARFMTACDNIDDWSLELLKLCEYMRINRTFYINALSFNGQNSFQEYLFEYIRSISMALIENIYQGKFDQSRWGFLSEFTATAFVGLMVRWAAGGMMEDPWEHLSQFRGIFDGSLLSEIESAQKSGATLPRPAPGQDTMSE